MCEKRVICIGIIWLCTGSAVCEVAVDVCSGGAAIEARLRAAIQDVYHCDVTKENPLEPQPLRQFGFVVAAGLFEAIAQSDAQYKQLVSNAKNVVAPGGTFLVDGDFGESFYYVNGKKFHVFNQSEELVKTTFQELGFGDIKMTFEHRDQSVEKGQQMFDAQAYFHMSCKRLA